MHSLKLVRSALRFVGLGATFLILAISTATSSYSATGLRIAIFNDIGADSDKILSLFRAVQAMGHTPLGITHSDVLNNRLTKANFDVFILPAGEGGQRCCSGHYADNANSLGSIAAMNAIRAYLNSGGGYFNVASNATVVARDTSNRPVIVRASYNAGRVVLGAFELSLRGDSGLDWTIWDNLMMGGVHANSIGAWRLLGRMIGFAYNGDASAPAMTETPNPTGARVAVVATHTTDGGIAPPLLPAVGRAIEFSGNIPLAIRFQEIAAGRLTLANFQVAFFDGGYAYGLKTGLAGQESKIRNFMSSGGAYWGDCAGSFYAASTIKLDGQNIPFPLGIYKGVVTGPINDIIPWPDYGLTPINVSGDSVIGDFGTIPTDAQQGSHVTTVGTYAYGGSAAGQAAMVRYNYGSGKVVLIATHLQSLPGNDELDWTFWDDYRNNSSLPLVDPDNTWPVFAALLNWLAGA
ncbi:hypothetical protein WDW86_08550 [Bdellovibrionota bacterium FG-2]